MYFPEPWVGRWHTDTRRMVGTFMVITMGYIENSKTSSSIVGKPIEVELASSPSWL